ncbi:DUF3089 domain-containing protein [Sphingomonas limnosediminicola]|uniref:DUF3089 domain-containing protein n=1 Tax=Sphingomonas limnosediminicola TaxID=940133 RepID=A0ABP7KSJ2_9SPHN
MCARRFLMVIFVLILLAVAAAFAIFQFGDRVLIKSAIPRGHFEAAAAGGGPDYAKAESWIARPGTANDPSRWLPDGMGQDRTGDAAIFYIHPTTYLDRDRWNAPVDAGRDTGFRTNLFVQSQGSAFNAAGEVWAPRYRQAAFGAFLLDSADAKKALDLAYSDVSAAFDQFVKEAGDRPIILAGHSQGALHLERLLKDKIAGKPIASRIVAAYVIGWPVSTTADAPALGLPPCRTDLQTGCILSWLSFADPANPELVLNSYEKSSGFSGAERRRQDLLCVNPISGSRNGTATPDLNPGTLVPSGNLMSASLLPGAVGAHCDKGLLLLDGKIPALGRYVLPGNNYHVYDYALFWGAIRRDAERRLAVWHQ